MLHVENPFYKYISCRGYHNDKFVIIRYYLLECTEVRVKIQKNKTLHISAKGLQNFPFKIGKSFVSFYAPAYIEYYRNKNYDKFMYLLEEFIERIWFE